MLWELPTPALLVLGLLMWVMVTSSLKVLAMRYHNTTSLHDRVRESKLMREEYQRVQDENDP
ncbi:MAG: hypothetical protein HC898_04340 [Phycisphaerales bacterium]|nr:hypothetical protein [Phycisphaerales bacterium]